MDRGNIHTPLGGRGETRVNRVSLIGSGSKANFNVYFSSSCLKDVSETLTKTNRVLLDVTFSVLTYHRHIFPLSLMF